MITIVRINDTSDTELSGEIFTFDSGLRVIDAYDVSIFLWGRNIQNYSVNVDGTYVDFEGRTEVTDIEDFLRTVEPLP